MEPSKTSIHSKYADVVIMEGGIDESWLKLKLQSQKGQGFSYRVVVYSSQPHFRRVKPKKENFETKNLMVNLYSDNRNTAFGSKKTLINQTKNSLTVEN